MVVVVGGEGGGHLQLRNLIGQIESAMVYVQQINDIHHIFGVH